jgi:hypothetical protein
MRAEAGWEVGVWAEAAPTVRVKAASRMSIFFMKGESVGEIMLLGYRCHAKV